MKTRLTLARAAEWANHFAARLAPVCERVLVAGSIRRRKPEVGDVEVVCVPRIEQIATPGDLFTGPGVVERDLLLAELDRLVADRALYIGPRQGPRFRQYRVPPLDGACLDLFVVRPPAQWGAIVAIRTGPADYSQWLVTHARRRGLVQVQGHLEKDGFIAPGGQRVIDTPTEESFFDALGLDWVAPELRVCP